MDISKIIKETIMVKVVREIDKKINEIEAITLSKVPVDTGRLKASWFKRTLVLNENQYKKEFGYDAKNEQGTYYGKFPDLGTVKQPAQHFFTRVVLNTFGLKE
jgi:hypothetical protein